jgi:insecticidal toxin complex protein TccC
MDRPVNPGVDSHTPHLAVIDSRGVPVRQVAYCRRDVSELIAQARVTAQENDAAGRAVAQRDPRFLAPTARPNLSTVYSLSGAVLLTDSVDAGWRLGLSGEAAQVLERWDGRGSQWRYEFDEQLRPTAIHEQTRGVDFKTIERLTYADNSSEFVERNQCGQLIRHDDPAGTQLFAEFGLTGGLLAQTRHFLRELDSPDWPESLAERDTLLEPGAGATTRSRVNPLGEALEQTDAKGNRQFCSQTVDGQLHEVRLQLAKDTAPTTLVSDIQYNAHGQIERETAGNGVLTMLEYTAEDGRLTRLQAKRGNDDLQHLRYAYDPVGNVLSIEDGALPIRYFANQRIEPINRYRYDSLYQLIEATGWEAGAANQGPSSSVATDPAAVGNYRQTYRYDAGNNLLELIHVGPQNPGHRLVAAAHSNRCLPVRNGVEPGEEDFRNGFDANGNLLNLQPGQALSWDLRNQLREVCPVERDSGTDDSERYLYGTDGMRVRKVRSTQTDTRTLISEVRYLPGLEFRTHSGTGEVLQVISVQTGRGSVRVLHWEAKRPVEMADNQQRYSLSDHLGSATLELDQDAKVISQERYYPFGGTAWADGEAVQVSYKTVRYSGKERDATGLDYYGFRYYASWLQRWINSDPAGTVDGLNLYCMVRNNPVTLSDPDGLESTQDDQLIIHMFYHGEIPGDVSSNIINTIKTSPDNRVYLWFDDRARKTFPNLSGVFPNFEIKDVGELKYVKPRDGSASFSNIKNIFLEVEGADNKGKEKSLSDLSELLATYQYSGLYLDADVVVHKEFSKSELFGDSDFRTHVSIDGSKADVDYYDALAFKNAFDGDLEEVLKELSSDYEEGYLVGASEPGQLVRIKEIVRLKLKRSLSEGEIDDALSEDVIPEGSLSNITEALRGISISTALKGGIQFMPMK